MLADQFSNAIEMTFKEIIAIKDWNDLFDYLDKKSGVKKLVIVIDEFQRIATFSKDFIYSLQDNWDRKLKNRKILFIISGSSMRMMHKLVLEEHGTLYGRTTFRLPLKQFSYCDFRLMFESKNEEEKINIFSMFGGTPKYLSDFKSMDVHLMDAFNKLVLSENGSLYDEPLNALTDELRNPERYLSIIETISQGKLESNEIATALQLKNSELSPYLRNLIDLLDIIESNDPIFGKKRMKRYKLKDNFFKFWFKFVFPYRQYLKNGDHNFILDKIEKEFSSYCGHIFEEIVRDFFLHINKQKIMNKYIDFYECGSWWDDQDEIDLILKNNDETIFVEIKHKEKPIDITCFEELKRKSKKTLASGKFYYILISKSGFEPKLKNLDVNNLLLIDLVQFTEILEERQKQQKETQRGLDYYSI